MKKKEKIQKRPGPGECVLDIPYGPLALPQNLSAHASLTVGVKNDDVFGRQMKFSEAFSSFIAGIHHRLYLLQNGPSQKPTSLRNNNNNNNNK